MQLYLSADTLSLHLIKYYINLFEKNKHHVKKTTLIANPDNGGLKMPDTEAVIKANKLIFMERILTVESNCNKLHHISSKQMI